ncbi:MAG: PIN domain-containing protein [Dehalococcoidia bacterium]|nr:PIN domain-containing protein [Dehalococcoidia bacterium]
MNGTIEEGYLLDTSVASAVFDKGSPGHFEVRNNLEQLGEGIVYICPIAVSEIEYGLKVAPSIDSDRQLIVRSAMAQYECLDIDYYTSEPYSDIRANLFKKYSPRDRRNRLTMKRVEDLIEPTTGKELGIDENDLWIVSTAVEYNLVFITRDQKGSMKRIVEAADYTSRTLYW